MSAERSGAQQSQAGTGTWSSGRRQVAWLMWVTAAVIAAGAIISFIALVTDLDALYLTIIALYTAFLAVLARQVVRNSKAAETYAEALAAAGTYREALALARTYGNLPTGSDGALAPDDLHGEWWAPANGANARSNPR